MALADSGHSKHGVVTGRVCQRYEFVCILYKLQQ